MTGRRFCIDWPDFSRKLSQETLKRRFSGFLISWKVTSTQNGTCSHRLHPNWSAMVTEWSMGALGSFQNGIKNNRNPNKKNVGTCKSRNLQRRAQKDHRDWFGWNPLNFHGVPFGDKSDASWALMMHHGYSHDAAMIGIRSTHDASWVLMIMNTHGASWVLMMHHEYSWCIMSTFWGGPWCSSTMPANQKQLCGIHQAPNK